MLHECYHQAIYRGQLFFSLQICVSFVTLDSSCWKKTNKLSCALCPASPVEAASPPHIHRVTLSATTYRYLRSYFGFAVGPVLLFSRRCTVVPALLAEGMPTIVEVEMEVVLAIRDLAVPLAFPVLLGWDTVAPTAPKAMEEVLEEEEAKPFPWKTSSPSMQRMPTQDQCT